MTSSTRQRWRSSCALALVVVACALTITCGLTSARWIGTVFPGFFVMANRVIASVSLPHWPVAQQQELYQQQVIAVDDQIVESSDELYALVSARPPGSPVTYTVEKHGQQSRVTLPAQIFTAKDYYLLFLAYLFTGLTIVLTGLGVWFLQPAAPASRALCLAGVATGLFGLTGADLYAPHWFFRLHVLGEAFFPAGYFHLALVFPVDRLRPRSRSLLITLPYVAAGALGVAYELWLYQPTAYSVIHNLCMIYAGIAGAVLLGGVLWDYRTTDSHLVRQRIRVIFLGFLGGYGFPIVLMSASGLTGGEVAVNYIAFTGFLFPLSLGYAIVKHDLFEIDALLKRAVYYLTLTALLTGAYVLVLAVLNFILLAPALTRSPLFPLFFTLAAVFLLNPLKERLQEIVDRLFFRRRYQPQAILEQISGSLASPCTWRKSFLYCGPL